MTMLEFRTENTRGNIGEEALRNRARGRDDNINGENIWGPGSNRTNDPRLEGGTVLGQPPR